MNTDSRHPMAGMDAYAPAQIAELVETRGVAKANAPAVPTFVLGVLAGAFIGLGGMLSTVVETGSELGLGITRWLSGLAFSLGLVLVVVAGAELFTGNNLIVMGVVSGRITLGRLLRNWGIVYVGNAVGAVSIAAMAYGAEWWRLGDDAVGVNALGTAASKTSLSFGVVFVRAILANALVCLAVWLATGARSVGDKVVSIMFPVAAFVACSFEHSIANLYFVPLGLLLEREPEIVSAANLSDARLDALDLGGFLQNLLASTAGNAVGGAVLVGLVYAFVYRRREEDVA